MVNQLEGALLGMVERKSPHVVLKTRSRFRVDCKLELTIFWWLKE